MNRLAILLSVTAAISRENNLDRILSLAADHIIEADGIDGVLIYLKSQVKNEIELKQYRGISPETAQQFNRIQTEDRLQEYFASRAQYKDNAGKVITCNFLAELKAQQKTAGMLCVLSASASPLTEDDGQFLELIGEELGLALEKAVLSDEKEKSDKNFKELFERAHDAIWIQDADGKILDANQAASDFTGYRRERLIGGDVIRSLNPRALELAREIRYKLLNGISVQQPYEQRITRRDGSEAVVMMTTTVIRDEGKPVVFQNISRDVTREKKLAENLRLYAQQITRTQEDERKRIARI